MIAANSNQKEAAEAFGKKAWDRQTTREVGESNEKPTWQVLANGWQNKFFKDNQGIVKRQVQLKVSKCCKP